MNYLPASVETDIIFRENSWTKKFTFEEGYLDGKVVEYDLWNQNQPLGVKNTITQSGDIVNLSLDIDQVRELPSSFKYYIIFDGEYILGGSVLVRMGTGENDSTDTSIHIEGDKVVSVQLPGFEAINNLTQIAQDAAENAENDRIQTGEDLIIVSELAAQVAEDRLAMTFFSSSLPSNTETIIPGTNIGDLLGTTLRDIIEKILTEAVAAPANNMFPFTLPFNLS